MKALVSVSNSAAGTCIYLLGAGDDEQAARRAAYTLLHSGHNLYDEEHRGGTLIDCAPEFACTLQAGDYTRYMSAIGSLYIDTNGWLDSRSSHQQVQKNG